jgi:hypothetical protein
MTPTSPRYTIAAGICLCLLLSSCNYIFPNKDITGSVFVVTQGAGTYKLALVKVYFCKEEDVSDEIISLKKDYSDQMSQAKVKCDSVQREFLALSKRRIEAHAIWLKQCKDDALIVSRYKEARAKAINQINSFLYIIALFKSVGAGIPNLSDPNWVAPSEETLHPTKKDYASAFNDDDLLRALQQMEADKLFHPTEKSVEKPNVAELPSVMFKKALSELNDAAQIENQKMADQNNIEVELEAKQAELNNAIDSAKQVPSLIAKQSLILSSKAIFTAVTDEDGHFNVANPRGFKNFIVVASSQREVNPGDAETYFWIVPFVSDNNQLSKCDLNNSNELLTGEDGGKILQFPPFDDSTYNYSIQPL